MADGPARKNPPPVSPYRTHTPPPIHWLCRLRLHSWRRTKGFTYLMSYINLYCCRRCPATKETVSDDP